jgi:hypothetical protein
MYNSRSFTSQVTGKYGPSTLHYIFSPKGHPFLPCRAAELKASSSNFFRSTCRRINQERKKAVGIPKAQTSRAASSPDDQGSAESTPPSAPIVPTPTCAPTSTHSNGFCVIWVCISSSCRSLDSSFHFSSEFDVRSHLAHLERKQGGPAAAQTAVL